MKKIIFIVTILFLLVSIQLVAQNRIDSKYIVRTFIDENGNSIDEIIVPGRPPVDYRAPIAEPTDATVILPNIPAFDWSFGCSATTAAMMAGHYDNTIFPDMYTGPTNGGVMPMTNAIWGSVTINGEVRKQCPLSATRNGIDGRSTLGHVDDYWHSYNSSNDPYYGNWIQHTYDDCTADYMGTNQYQNFGNTDGATTFYNYTNGAPLYDYTACEPAQKDGTHGLKQFFESRGYAIQYSSGNYQNYSQYIYGYNGNTIGFTYNQFKAEIDAGRPVLIQVEGHTMLGYGYDDSSNLVYIKDTWDYSSHTMTWGGTYGSPPNQMQHYAVGVFILEDPAITVTVPNGSESWDMGSTQNITWTSQYVNNVDINLYYSGSHVMTIVGNQTASSGTFSWPIPTGLTASTTYSIRISDSDASATYDDSDAYFTLNNLPSDPTDISIVSGTLTQTQVDLTWSGTSPEFRVVRTTGGHASTPTSGTLVYEGSSTSATATSLTANSTYFFTVYGKSSGSSTYSNGNQYLCAVTEATSGATTATVPTGQTGEFTFGTTGSVIDINTNGDPDGGTIDSQKFNTAPSGNNTISGSATAPDGSTVIPNIFSNERYWTISSTLTGTNAFTVYLNISGLTGVTDPDRLLILKRDSGGWIAQNTLRSGNLLYSDITSFSDFIIGANSGDNPLPVILSSFTAAYINGSPVINWVTQSESDNIGWNVYRSNSYNFGQAYMLNLETIPGNGTTSQPSFYSYTDEYEVFESFTYWYWLESISGSGETESYGPVSLTIPTEGNDIPEIPLATELRQNFPNPFNPSTLISFDIKENETGILSIYNIVGQLIITEDFETGRHQYAWDARDQASGVYLYKLKTKRYSKIMKMLLIK